MSGEIRNYRTQNEEILKTTNKRIEKGLGGLMMYYALIDENNNNHVLENLEDKYPIFKKS